jgi:hypothetical protein
LTPSFQLEMNMEKWEAIKSGSTKEEENAEN